MEEKAKSSARLRVPHPRVCIESVASIVIVVSQTVDELQSAVHLQWMRHQARCKMGLNRLRGQWFTLRANAQSSDKTA